MLAWASTRIVGDEKHEEQLILCTRKGAMHVWRGDHIGNLSSRVQAVKPFQPRTLDMAIDLKLTDEVWGHERLETAIGHVLQSRRANRDRQGTGTEITKKNKKKIKNTESCPTKTRRHLI